MLRIVAGKYKNTRLEQPPKEITRASSEKLREAIFSSLQFDIEGKTFLDLFGGSGAFCFEAISRGIKSATIVEKNFLAFKTIKQNKAKFSAEDIEIHNKDAIKFLTNKATKTFDFVFVDPPYKMSDLYTKSLQLLFQNDWINQDTMIIVETDNETFNCGNNYEIVKTKKYGISYIFFLIPVFKK
ncbi:16S rRNA (guanine(966)-N(2))-methyltransferase RsmD [[Mycoplasma] gypis]|uniref:16S rRNA (Guanine(966)-N(2))-methyltransferase RsmD n=1 Tax=[Mycoplasma] gypis TaxID=92404 RepID=A0ABZ2RP40_9BACT|nr:16S rRNA (guanine(966)-N(2))-methyltransferase RsmD [[Mycoplasma] gypis]MBN0919117.1 16S rRNA (guanine(966)-N(2))-methyltransferase RsmD [[Mycoplasma] gypis]